MVSLYSMNAAFAGSWINLEIYVGLAFVLYVHNRRNLRIAFDVMHY